MQGWQAYGLTKRMTGIPARRLPGEPRAFLPGDLRSTNKTIVTMIGGGFVNSEGVSTRVQATQLVVREADASSTHS